MDRGRDLQESGGQWVWSSLVSGGGASGGQIKLGWVSAILQCSSMIHGFPYMSAASLGRLGAQFEPEVVWMAAASDIGVSWALGVLEGGTKGGGWRATSTSTDGGKEEIPNPGIQESRNPARETGRCNGVSGVSGVLLIHRTINLVSQPTTPTTLSRHLTGTPSFAASCSSPLTHLLARSASEVRPRWNVSSGHSGHSGQRGSAGVSGGSGASARGRRTGRKKRVEIE